MPYFKLVVSAVEFIEIHLKDDISVSDIAKISGLSNWHFQRVFNQTVGETAGSYLRRRRLACAVEELRGTSAKVIDVALNYQFGSPEAFSRSFKSEFGISPQQLKTLDIRMLPFKKPALSHRQINYIVRDLELIPAITEVAPIQVMGLLTSFPSPLSKRLDYMTMIPGIWKDFRRREGEIPHAVAGIAVGVIEGIASPHHHIHDDMMDYLACKPVSKIEEIPEGFQTCFIPGGEYAVFTGIGYHEQTQFLVDYVYSTWLPQAEYVRASGPEFTWLDHRVHPLDPVTSEVEYYLPVRKKET